MKITIRPPIEIETDGDRCQIYCRFFGSYATCRLFGRNLNVVHGKTIQDSIISRCQACLDAEKEMNDAGGNLSYTFSFCSTDPDEK